MRCVICQREFNPNKYRPSQKVCSDLACQKARQLQNVRDWRIKNPDYFKCLGQESSWRENRHRYSKLWKGTHEEYLKEYAKRQKPQRREYMKEYMRTYRLGRKAPSVNIKKS